MKKLLLGTVILLLFAISIATVQSCEKIHGQNRPQSPSSTRTVLFTTAAISVIEPRTTIDSNGNTVVIRIDTEYTGLNLFVCNIDGSNVRQIPINLPTDEIVTSPINFNICLTPNADSVFFTVGQLNPPLTFGVSKIIGIFTCALDGSGLRQVISSAPAGFGSVTLRDVK